MTINYQQPYYGQNQFGYNPYPYMYQPFAFPNNPYDSRPDVPPIYNEQSYIENILRLNKGKIVTIYMSFEGSQWGSKIFRGEIMEAGRDHIILKDVQNKVNYLLLTIYLSYITFDETIDYDLNRQE